MDVADAPQPLRHLLFLYLAMAHRSGTYPSTAKLNRIAELLCIRHVVPTLEDARELATSALAAYADESDPQTALHEAIAAVPEAHDTDAQIEILDDLRAIAAFDGMMHRDERTLLQGLATTWGLAHPLPPRPPQAALPPDLGALPDLAYIYLVLAHAPDYTLTEEETALILRTLQRWEPRLDEEQAQAVLDHAIATYADVPTETQLSGAIDRVRRLLSAEQRDLAFRDLVGIANADGVFLDSEEDLINRLGEAWGVTPYSAGSAPPGDR